MLLSILMEIVCVCLVWLSDCENKINKELMNI